MMTPTADPRRSFEAGTVPGHRERPLQTSCATACPVGDASNDYGRRRPTRFGRAIPGARDGGNRIAAGTRPGPGRSRRTRTHGHARVTSRRQSAGLVRPGNQSAGESVQSVRPTFMAPRCTCKTAALGENYRKGVDAEGGPASPSAVVRNTLNRAAPGGTSAQSPPYLREGASQREQLDDRSKHRRQCD